MKKFKSYHPKTMMKRIVILIISIILLILFILASFQNLGKSYSNFIMNIMDENRIIDVSKKSFISSFLNNFDHIINNYYFLEQDKIISFNDSPVIYLYNTHDTETYLNDNVSFDISFVSKMLQDNLNSLNLNSLVETKKISTYLTKYHYSYEKSYEISRDFLKESISNYGSLHYFIDIHRDSALKEETTITINNKTYARIMFVLGLKNKNYLENKKLMIKMNDYLNNHYPGLSRGIYEKDGNGVNGIYNQDLNGNIILLEVGGVDNTLNEVSNSTKIMAQMLYDVLGD